MAMVKDFPHSKGSTPMVGEREFSEKEVNAALDRPLQGKTPEEILGQTGLVKDLTRRLVERRAGR
jgi:hypothetical protein